MLTLVSKSNYMTGFYRKHILLSDFHITDDMSKKLFVAAAPFITQFLINNSNETEHGSEDINLSKDFPYHKEAY